MFTAILITRSVAKLSSRCCAPSAGRRAVAGGPVPRWTPVTGRWRDSTVTARSFSSVSDQTSSSPRRALLFVPADDEEKIRKLSDLNQKLDCAVIDCEDLVQIDSKAKALEVGCGMLNSVAFPNVGDVAMRINSRQSIFAEDDLAMILKNETLPDTLIIPKVDAVEDIHWLMGQLKSCLQGREMTAALKIVIMMESALSLLRLPQIISEAQELFESEPFFLDGIAFGCEDYCVDVGINRSPNDVEVLYARQQLVTIAKAYGLQAMDMAHLMARDLDELTKYAEEGARMGYTGKMIIDASEIAAIQQAFSPSLERIEWARELLAGWEEHTKTGQGVFIFKSNVIELPAIIQAKKIMELYKAHSSSETSQ